MTGVIRILGLAVILAATAPCGAFAAPGRPLAGAGVAQAPPGSVRLSPPAEKVPAPPEQPGARAPELPPGWTWGVETDRAGNRVLVPVAPDEALPAPAGLADDPVERAKSRLDMLRMALEAYYSAHRPGLSVYPEAKSLDDLVRILRRERTLPEGWDPGGVVTEFKIDSTRYLLRVAVGRELLTIEPPHRDNPLAMFWIPPHRP